MTLGEGGRTVVPMQTTVTTTVKSEIDIETFEPTHSVDIASEEGLPQEVVLAAALGGTRAAANSISEMLPRVETLDTFVNKLVNEEIDDAEFRRRVVGFVDGD